MRTNSRMAVTLHVLLHMEHAEGALTSEAIAAMMETNAVVMRRTMAGLREAGIVRSEKGHGGGWSLAKKLEKVTLAEVYEALGAPSIFGIGNRVEEPKCLVERAVNGVLGKTLDEAEALVLKRLGQATVADIAEDVRKMPEWKKSRHGHGRAHERGAHTHA